MPKRPSTETRMFRTVKNEKSVHHKMHLSKLGQSQVYKYKSQVRYPLFVHIYIVAKKYQQQDLLPQILMCQRQLYFPSRKIRKIK